MKTNTSFLLLLFLISGISISAFGQGSDMNMVQEEIKEFAIRELKAFKNGDCTVVLSLMEDNITFLANGRPVASKAIIEKFCNGLPRPFKEPVVDNLEIHPLTPDSGYTVRTLEYKKNDETRVRELVTKIWIRTENGWKISHLHSTVHELPQSR